MIKQKKIQRLIPKIFIVLSNEAQQKTDSYFIQNLIKINNKQIFY